jgi:hypothetical protein
MSLNTILATTPLTSTGYHLKATGTALGQSLIWDNGTNVGIGNQGTTYTLDVSGTGRFTGALTGTSATFTNNLTVTNTIDILNAGVQTGQLYSDASDFYVGGQTGKGLRLCSNNLGNTRMYINTSGNVGIGTSSPSYSLHIVSTSSWLKASYSSATDTRATELYYTGIKTTASTSQSNNMLITMEGGYTPDGSGSIVFSTGSPTATERMRITSAGQVGIGGTPNSWDTANVKVLQLKGTALWTFGSGVASFMSSNIYYDGSVRRYIYADYAVEYAQNAGSHIWYSNPAGTAGDSFTPIERMRITSGGVILFGGTTFTPIASALLGSTNPAFTGRNWSFGANSSGDYVVYHNAGGGNAGVYLTYGGSSWTSNSDENIKDIIEIIPNALDSIKDLRAVKFYWKGDESKKENLGLIAQDVEKSYPQLIDKQLNDNNEVLGVRYTELIPVLVKAIQEQQAQIEELKKIVATK